MNRKQFLYVENISPSSSEEHLITYLEKFAPVQAVYFLREKQCTKRSIAGFVRAASEADLDLLMLRNHQNYRGKRLFMARVDQPQFFQADHSIIVRNITTKISEENLYEHFEECGKIAFLQIRTDDFAYVGFEDKLSVRNAMNKNNQPLKGSNLKIQVLTRNIEIMIVNLDTLQSRMPELYRKMVLPAEPRPAGAAQQQQQQSKPAPQQQQQSQPARQQQQQQPQQQGNQQQYSQPAKQQQQQTQPPRQQQQQTGNQQQQNQRQQQQNQQQQQQRGQQQQQRLPQQQPQPQRQQLPQQHPLPQRQQQQQPQPQRQQMSTIQLLKEKANAFAGKQQQAPVAQPAKPTPPVQAQPKATVPTPVPAPAPTPTRAATSAKPVAASTPLPTPAAAAPVAAAPDSDDADDVQIIEPMDTTEVIEESDSEIPDLDPSVIPPIPSAYKAQPGDIMRPVKAAEITMSVAEVKTERDNRCVWVNNIPPEATRLHLVMYMEQFGDVESCKIGSSTNCYFTRWAKVCYTSEAAALRATEYFLHPFQGRYLFVLACNRCIDEMPGKVFAVDYLSKYLVYEDVAKRLKPIGDVFYLVRLSDNSHKVRIFFLRNVDAKALAAVRTIAGIPVNIQPFHAGMNIKICKEDMEAFKREREIMDPKKEARMAKILAIYKEEALNRCEAVVNPEGKSESNIVLVSNIHKSTTRQQLENFFRPIGVPTFIRRENLVYSEGFERAFVGFRTLSMVLRATQLPDNLTLNDCKPFIFAAWTKPHMTDKNAVRFFFSEKSITVQDIYNGLIHFGKIRYIEKEKPAKAVIVFDGHDNGFQNCKIQPGFFIGPVKVVGKESLLGKRSHDFAFNGSDSESIANPEIVASSAPSQSNPPGEAEFDSTYVAPIPLDDSSTVQEQPSADSSTVNPEEPVRVTNSDSFVIGTWNVSGCTEKSDRNLVDSFLNSHGVAVGCLQETRLSTGTMDTFNYHWYNTNRQATSAKWVGGTALVVRRDLIPDCKFRQVSDDICSVRLPVFGKMLTIVSVYARSSSGQTDPAIHALNNFLLGLPRRQHTNLVVLGDFNAHIGYQDLKPAVRQSVGKHLYHSSSNANGKVVMDIMEHHKLRLCSSYGPSDSVLCTWSRDNQKAQISHVMMTIVERFHRPACRCEQAESSFSDHRLLLLTVKHRLPAPTVAAANPTPKKKFQEYYEPPDKTKGKAWFTEDVRRLGQLATEANKILKKARTPENKERFRVAMANKMRVVNRLKKLYFRDPDNHNYYDGIDKYVAMLEALLDEAHGKSARKEEYFELPGQTKGKYWFTEEVRRLGILADEANRILKRAHTPENKERYRLAMAAKTREVRRLKRIYFRDPDNHNYYDGIDKHVAMLQAVLDQAHGKPAGKASATQQEKMAAQSECKKLLAPENTQQYFIKIQQEMYSTGLIIP